MLNHGIVHVLPQAAGGCQVLAPPLVVPAGAGATGCLRPGEAANCTEVLPPAPPDSESRGDVGSDCRWVQ